MNVTPEQAKKVLALLADSVPLRQIALQAGVSRYAIAQISKGTQRGKPIPRCPGCGGLLLVTPCLACKVDGLWKTALSRYASEESPLGLDLNEEDRAGYEKVRQKREAAGEMPVDEAFQPINGLLPQDIEAPQPRHPGYRGDLDNGADH